MLSGPCSHNMVLHEGEEKRNGIWSFMNQTCRSRLCDKVERSERRAEAGDDGRKWAKRKNDYNLATKETRGHRRERETQQIDCVEEKNLMLLLFSKEKAEMD